MWDKIPGVKFDCSLLLPFLEDSGQPIRHFSIILTAPPARCKSPVEQPSHAGRAAYPYLRRGMWLLLLVPSCSSRHEPSPRFGPVQLPGLVSSLAVAPFLMKSFRAEHPSAAVTACLAASPRKTVIEMFQMHLEKVFLRRVSWTAHLVLVFLLRSV